MKENYAKQCETVMNAVKPERPALLVHACCGPCASYVLPYLEEAFSLTVLYYNPCIMPESEYLLRAENLKKVAENLKYHANLIIADYDVKSYLDEIAGCENSPEGGKRCELCIAQRMRATAKKAADEGFEYFCTTLTVSPHKNAAFINEIGYKLAEEYGVKWLPSDFKKGDGFKKSVENSETLGLYRQNYCGCVFSEKQSAYKK